ncbi:Alpha-N-acetylglucosaminidase [Tolypocladium paradoxum]|uniref:Alpha-N-acetylglucosaminidase n=1 Tax=Tolypocladium paradoxum TaxID=94208 RepID=A0A2S4L153_9HYPO|nr:Alpha-N-acetylglucosaminidase [Tolypocladium paradoxum]
MRVGSLFTALVGVVAGLSAPVTAIKPSAGVEALVQRRLPQHAGLFQFTIVDPISQPATGTFNQNVSESYVVSSINNGKIHIQGNTPSALLSGLHAYLSEEAHVDIWWYIGSQLENAPRQLPKLSAPLKRSSVVPYRYYFNTVTTSYTSAFWTWEDWELQLDWMALRGVNLALAWIGVEKIFIDVFKEVGLTDAEIATFLSGPAFVAWNHFGNIQGSWGGDLPTSWIDSQFALQKKIVARMVELGMAPILPAFPGFAPRTISRVFPNITAANGSVWEGFPTQYTADTFIDPFDPVFEQLQKSFIAKQAEAYGNVTRFYTLDQFNENNPPSGELDYLHNVSQNTWKTLKAADPLAVWVMQGWLFTSNSAFWTNDRIQAFIEGVPNNSDMLILDLVSESSPQWQRTNSYYGKPWVWCELHGYGGNMGLYGQVENVTVNSIQALGASRSLVGFGVTMEGQEGNEVMYDLILSQAWSAKPIGTKAYFHDWVAARYSISKKGAASTCLYQAWETLRTSVFNNTNLASTGVPKSIMELIPSTLGLVNRTGHHPTSINYNPASMVQGWKYLYKAAQHDPSLWANPSYNYDLVDFTRQVLANAFIPLYQPIAATYTKSQQSAKCRGDALKKQGQQLIKLMTVYDAVLSTDKNFRLDTWISAARASASDAKTADFLEYEARNQITLWGPSGQISDYASKAWSGLVSTYYIPRWEKFIDYLVETEPAKYNQTAFAASLLQWEINWTNQKTGGKLQNNAVEKLQTVLPGVVKDWNAVFAA